MHQPWPERLTDPNCPGLANHHEECRLEGVLGGGRVAEHAAAAREHGWPVPGQDRLECRVGCYVAAGDAIQELGLGQGRHAPALE